MVAPFERDVDSARSANSYAILAKLATGGMAELFLARTVSTAGVERHVVLKRVLPDRVKDTNFVAMFLDEAKLASQLQHPNIAQVFDTGMLGDSYFFSMEYVHGETVRELINRSCSIDIAVPIGCALTIAAQTAAGLHHAHERLGVDGQPLGIVHRDVSPSNLMVTYEGNVKVVDFGVAKTTVRSADTQRGTVKGKIGYLSPEQCRGRAADRRSDLFSVGIVLWELLVGQRMYKRDNDYDTMEAIVLEPPEPPSKYRPEVPPELDAAVLKLLAKAPGDRFQTGDELHEELERVADSTGFRISTAALKRFALELFGKRQEPWIEVQTRDAAQEIVTVSAAAAIGTVLTTLTASQLSNVPDLTRSYVAGRSPSPSSLDDETVADEPRVDANKPGLSPSHAARYAVTDKIREQESLRPQRRVGAWIASGALVAGAVAWYAVGRAGDPPAAAEVAPAPAPAMVPAHAEPAAPLPAKPEPAKPEPAKAEPPSLAKPDKPAKPDKREAAKREPKPEPKHRTSEPVHRADTLASDLRAGRFEDVVDACQATRGVRVRNIGSCTLSACKVHDTVAARTWFASVPSRQRDALAQRCAAAGTPVVVKKAEPVISEPATCDDPMACRK